MKRRNKQNSLPNPLELPSKRTKENFTASKNTWSESGSLMYFNFGSETSAKIIGFDMDNTLITTKSGSNFPADEEDWKILYPSIPSRMKAIEQEGYRIVIFTNLKRHDKIKMQAKIKSVLEALQIKALAMVCCGDDQYRKPCTRMWDFFIQQLNKDIQVDFSASKYVGGSAGRLANTSRKKDLFDTDLKFALNIGIPFETPEKFFLGIKDDFSLPEIDPRNIKKTGSVFKGESENVQVAKERPEVVIFVGSPGSGKSTFWNNYLSRYVRVNCDTLRSKEKCLKTMRQALVNKKSCVIDNTNPTSTVRAEYIKIAKDFDYPVRCFVFTLPKDLAFHLDTLRLVNKYREHFSERVGSMPIHKFYNDFEKPQLTEGFTEIKEIELVGGPFESPEEEKLFYSFVYS